MVNAWFAKPVPERASGFESPSLRHLIEILNDKLHSFTPNT